MNFVEEAQRIIDGFMALHDYEGEFICLVSKETTFKVLKHYYEGKFFGWNVYAYVGQDLKLLETYESKREARNVVESIREGLSLGATYYKVPGN